MKQIMITILIGIGLIVFVCGSLFCAFRYNENKVLSDCICGCSKYRLELTGWDKHDEWNIKIINFGYKITCPKCGRGGSGERIMKDDIKVYWNERTKENLVKGL